MARDARTPAPPAGTGDSAVTQDYLKAVWSASEWGGPGASITGLARRMGVAPSTASENVTRLVEAGLLVHEPYKAVTLTERGHALATSTVRRHRLLETYLVERLGLTWDEVHDEAEVLEHAVSDRLLTALDEALDHPVRDPHGDPVPAPDGTCVQPALRSVDTLRVGQTGVVGRILDDVATLRELAAAGIGLDTPVTVVDRVAASSPAAGEATGRSGRSARRRSSVLRAVLPVGAPRPEQETATVAVGSLWVLDERAR
ncbi:metal-dependent transcriptional regulator [Actinomyces radicidentis]|uniref:Manganese transport regulator n=1 Tax=Actinomyces radicidentis TaxID=111015 RepID=A0A0X8JGG3_ACTRD|nr:metal-dependent transcriptional regulator [Actinomyces radicidentis]AMD88184.1 iron dependent repressor, metal binding/dimerization domain protein [Actinomyces radicidentis]